VTPDDPEIACRVTTLEELVSHLERTLEQLHEVALEQGRELVTLRQELGRLKLRLGLLDSPKPGDEDEGEIPD